MTPTRTVWEEGRESGREVVALGFALALTVVVVDVAAGPRVGWFFDLCFVALCIALALAVRPSDFFVVGVLPPLLMGGLFTLLAVARPASIGRADDGLVQATISGLSHHSLALLAGYASCLAVLWVRQRVAAARSAETRRASQTSKRSGSPAPRRITSGTPEDQSTTVVGSAGVSPASMTRSTS